MTRGGQMLEEVNITVAGDIMFHVSSHSRPWEGGWLDGCSALRQYWESSAAPLHDGGLWTRRLFIGYWLISGHWIFLWSDAAAMVISLPSLQLCVFSVLWAANIHSHDQSPDTCQQCLNSDRVCWLQYILEWLSLFKCELQLHLWLCWVDIVRCSALVVLCSHQILSLQKLFFCVESFSLCYLSAKFHHPHSIEKKLCDNIFIYAMKYVSGGCAEQQSSNLWGSVLNISGWEKPNIRARDYPPVQQVTKR